MRFICSAVFTQRKKMTKTDYEGRSANSQILILIRDAIEKYEEKHGKIEI